MSSILYLSFKQSSSSSIICKFGLKKKTKKGLALSLSLSIGQIQKHKRNNFQRQRVAARNIGHRVRSIGTVKQRLLPPFRMLDGSKYRETRTGWLGCLTRCSSFSGRWQQQEQTTHFLICTPPHGSFCPIFFFVFRPSCFGGGNSMGVNTLLLLPHYPYRDSSPPPPLP